MVANRWSVRSERMATAGVEERSLGALIVLFNLRLFLPWARRDREERLAALTAAQQEAMEELQKKIQLKVGTRLL